MTKQKMTREECSAAIVEHLEKVMDIYREYAGKRAHTLSIYIEDDAYMINNNYWKGGKDFAHPLNFIAEPDGIYDIIPNYFELKEGGNDASNYSSWA